MEKLSKKIKSQLEVNSNKEFYEIENKHKTIQKEETKTKKKSSKFEEESK